MRAHSVTIALLVIVLAVFGILAMLAIEQNKMQEQLTTDQKIVGQIKDIASRLQAGAADRTSQYNDLNRHMDCIVKFFSQPDRSEKSIANVNTCELVSAYSSYTFPAADGTATPDQPLAQTPPSNTPNKGTATQLPSKKPVSQNIAPTPVAPVIPAMPGLLDGIGEFLHSLTPAL